MDTPILQGPIRHASAWKSQEASHQSDWILQFTPEMSAEVRQAIRRLSELGKNAPYFSKADFPLTTTKTLLDEAMHHVAAGRGFVLLRGLDIRDLDHQAIKNALWGFGCQWGTAVTQNKAGEAIVEISDRGVDPTKVGIKPSMTNAEQRPHSDPSDVVALMCVQKAAEGGASRIASTMAIYNALLKVHLTEELRPLYRGFYHDLRGDDPNGADFGCTPYPIPVYRFYEGWLSSVFNATSIKDASIKRSDPIPEAEMKLIDEIVDLARSEEFRLEMQFEPGDIQLLNNYTTLHWRTGFRDHDAPELKRRLFRLWLNVPGFRSIDPAMHQGYITGSSSGRPISTEVSHS